MVESSGERDGPSGGAQVLMTHGPPLGCGDRTVRGEAVGCADSLASIVNASVLEADDDVAPRHA